MLKHRVIPCLLLQNGGLVKTRRFANPVYVGDPINAIRIFNEKEVDELIVLDIQASRGNAEPDFDLIAQFAGECFMPLCYGGGVRTLEHAGRLFELGVEKICLQTAAIQDMRLVREIANRFGSQSVLFSLDIKRNWLGRPRPWVASRRRVDRRTWQQLLREAVQAGAGEVVLNATDRDGMMRGVDEALIREAASMVGVPVIAIGGVGSLDDIRRAVQAGASAVSAGAFFVFHGPHRAVLITYPRYEELELLLAQS
jgi:cyclase